MATNLIPQKLRPRKRVACAFTDKLRADETSWFCSVMSMGEGSSLSIMAAPVQEDVGLTAVRVKASRPPSHRRHTFGVTSSFASSGASPPVVWRPVMPRGRRSTLVASPEALDEFPTPRDSCMRPFRSNSEATSLRAPAMHSTFALHHVDAFSVERAKVIRHVNTERFERICTFFTSYEPVLTAEIQAQRASSQEQLFAWINYIVSPKVLRSIKSARDSLEDVLDLVMVSAAISKYGESELMAKDRRGELRSGSSQPIAMDFVLRINERLAEEKRVGNVVLGEIVAHARTMTIEGEAYAFTEEEDQFTELVRRVQSEWFQGAMVKTNGRHLYDSLRQLLTSVSESCWDASKDKIELRRERLERGSHEVKRQSGNERQRRPLPPSSRQKAGTMVASSPTSIATKRHFSVSYRSSSVPFEELQELNVETATVRRKLLPLELMQRPRGLPPKLPQRKLSEPIARSSTSFARKVKE